MPEVLQQLWVLLKNFLYWVGICALFIVTFMIGYVTASNRLRRAKAVSEPVDLDVELNHLETQVDQAQKAVAKLLNKAKPPQTETGTQSWSPNVYIKHGKWNRLKGFLLNLFSRIRGAKELEDNPHIERLRHLKEEIKVLTSDLERVFPWLDPVKRPRNDQGAVTKLSDNAMETMTDSNDDNLGEHGSTGFYISSNASVDAESQVDLPTIKRPYQRDSRQVSRADIDSRFSSSSPARNLASEIIRLYNRAVTDTAAREQFREQYQPLRVGTVNAVERRQNPTIDAEFKETTDGDFFALPIPGANEFAVVPRLGLTIEAVSYSAGAMGQVFNNPRYDAKLFYSRYCVRQPAIFKRDGDRWELLSPGDLDLGPGD